MTFAGKWALSITVLMGLAAWGTDAAGAGAAKSSASTSGCEFGVEGSAPREAAELDAYLKAIRELGGEFFVCEFRPERNGKATAGDAPGVATNGGAGSPQGFRNFAAACRRANLTFFANQEITNYSVEGQFLNEDGRDVMAHADGTHRWDIDGELLEGVAKLAEFRGVLYDEPEHGQMRRHKNTNGGADNRSTGRVHPYFAATDGMTIAEAYDAVYHSAKTVAENYRRAGVTPMTEDVFPVMLHTFARAGFDPAIKFMKEGIDPVYAAIALGAARQYGREFCVSPDLWGLSGFPGHPPEELRASLLYAYWIGSTRIFVENVRGLIEKKEDGGVVRYEPTEYGKVYQWFVKEYVPAHPRSYCFRDIRPEVAIVRFDDSCWGQQMSWLPDALYGAANLKTTPETAAWFAIWNVLSHGQVHSQGISFHNQTYRKTPHDFFCPLRGAVMYDHLAAPKELDGLKLVFLSGVQISPATMEAVRAFVRKGGLCVTLDSLAPADLAGKSGEVADGSGRWLVTGDFRSDEVRKAVAPLLGKPDEISYRIGERLLTVRRGQDANTIRIYLQDETAVATEGETPESARVW